MMKTYSTKMSEVQHAWHVIDAADQPLGRLASQVASLLRGKHKPIYQPNLPVGDFVVVINASRVRVSGNKAGGKDYYRHSGYPGGLKVTPFLLQMEKNPRKVIEMAVRGMLPHNRLGRKLFTRLKVYAGPEHPHQAQVAGSPTPEAAMQRHVVVAAATGTDASA
jgi:large subunit ribosomal protein L13